MEVKKPSTYLQQLEKLENRGCLIDDEEAALDFLHRINHYRLTAYFLPLRNPDGTYKPGTTFTLILNIYEFDRKMRNILFPIIEEIELMLRTQLAYFHAHKYGALGYMEPENFNNFHNQKDFECHIANHKKENQLFVQHYNEKYDGNFPLWVIIELFTMGELSYFYSDLHRRDQKYIAKEVFGATDTQMRSWLLCLTYIRNACAHYSRLYYRLFPAIPFTPEGYPYTLGKHLFDYIIVLKFLYPMKNKWNSVFVNQIEALLEEYEEFIDMSAIGFIENWRELLY